MSQRCQQLTSLLACLPHHTFHVGRFSVGISLAICLMFGGESSFEPLISLNFLWMSAQIVRERQPLPHYFYWDDLRGRRLNPATLDRETAPEQPKAAARTAQSRLRES